MLFDPIPPDDLTPPAQWLLQSVRAGGQVEPEILAEALAYEHGDWLRRLGAAVLDGALPDAGAAAEKLLLAVLAGAVHQAHTYDADLGPRPWLASIALRAAREMEPDDIDGPPAPHAAVQPVLAALPMEARVAAVLRLLCAFSRDDIRRVPALADAALVWLPALTRAFGLPQEKGPAAPQTEAPAAPAGGDEAEVVYPWSRPRPGRPAAPVENTLSPQEQRLAEALQTAVPEPPPLPPERLNALAAKAARRAGRQEKRRRRRIAVNEMALISIAILVVLLVIWGADRLLPPEPDAPRATLPPPTRASYEANTLSTPRPTVTPMWRDHVAYVVQPGDTLETISEAAGVSVEEIQRTNGLTESEPIYAGQPLWVTAPAYSDPDAQVEWIKPAAHADDSIPPLLTIDSSPAAILERIRNSPRLWGNLWADYQMVYYGPQRYRPPARAYRFQVWVSQPDRSLEIFNELSSVPDMRHITLQGRSYTSAVRYAGAYLDPDWNHAPDVLLTNPLLRETIFPGDSQRFNTTMQIEPRGIEPIAGRSALIVAFSPLSSSDGPTFQLWIDRRLGVILRRQHFDFETDTGAIMSDMIVTRIELDAAFPAGLFNPVVPWEGGFAEGPSGYTQALNQLPPTPTWALPVTR